MLEIDGFEAQADLSDKSMDELAHMAIDAVIHIAAMNDVSIESVLSDMYESHKAVKYMREL